MAEPTPDIPGLPPGLGEFLGYPSFQGLSANVPGPAAPPQGPQSGPPSGPEFGPPPPVAAPPSPATPRLPVAGKPQGLLEGLPAMPTLPKRIAAPEPPKPEYSDPIMGLGKPLALIALLGSLFTRRPAIDAMNALASASMAQRQGDQTKYENSLKEYQAKLAKVKEEQQQENEEYQSALDNRKMTYDEKRAALMVTAGRRKDSLMTGALSGGAAGTASGGKMTPEQLIAARVASGKPVTEGWLKSVSINEIMEKAYKEGKPMTLAEASGEYERTKQEGKEKGKQGQLGDFTLSGDEFLNSIPVQYRDTIKAIADGRQAVPAGKWGESLREAAFHYKPELRGQAFAGSQSAERNLMAGELRRNIRAVNTLIGHLDRMDQNIAALDNTDFPRANKAFRAWAQETGDARFTPILDDIHAVAAELGRVFKGTVTEGEIKRDEAAIDSAGSPAQLKAAVREFLHLMDSRAIEIQREIVDTTGRTPQQAKDLALGPTGQAQHDRIEGGAPQPGAVMDGYRFKGGNPADQSAWEKVQ